MSKYFKMVDPEPPVAQDDGLPEFAKGDSWRIIKDGEVYVLVYMSGELAGREKSVVIEPADAHRLAAGEADIDAILIQYGVN